jgi:hypothetical protein
MPQYFNGEHWTPDAMRAWIGGLIDRAGRIIARPDTGRLTLTVTAGDQWVLHAIRDMYGAGDIDRHPINERLHVWRVKQPEHVRRILTDIAPFLASQADDAQTALSRIDAVLAQRAALDQRNREIRAMREEGCTRAEIAQAVGTSQQVVSQVIGRWRKENDVTIRQLAGRRRATRR